MREEERQALRPPTSGVIVGALADAIGRRPTSLTNRQASRYFRGDPSVSPEERQRVLEALAEWIVGLGLLPVPLGDGDHGTTPTPSQLLAMILSWHADQWDRLTSHVYARSGNARDLVSALEPYLRLATVDLALRATGLLCMAGADPPAPELPPWGKAKGVGRWQNSLRDEAKMTRDELANAGGVARQSADGWLDKGARPREERLSGIAKELAPRLGHDGSAGLTARLRRAYVLAAACDRLALVVGRPLVEMLAASLAMFIHRGVDALRSGASGPDGEDPARTARKAAAAMSLFLTGSSSPFAPGMLRIFWEDQADPEWRLAAQAAGIDWYAYIGLKLAARSSGEIAGPSIGMGRATNEALNVFREMRAESIDAIANEDWPRLRSTTVKQWEVLRAVLATSPGDAWLHMQVGSMEGKFGDARRGIQECWNAALLEDGRELPLVEIGIIYLNSGEPAKARDHLESVAARRKSHSWHLLYNLGIARYRCDDIGGALDALSQAIALNPVHHDMLGTAAHCAFLLRDHTVGRRFMNRARRWGSSSTYDRWRRREYRKRR